MTNTAKISCRVSASEPGLHLIIRVDDLVIFKGDPHQADMIEADLSDEDGEHELVFEMSGKTTEHTTVSADGTITKDVVAHIDQIAFDEIELGHIVTLLAQYHHDFNGTHKPITESFYGTMGCNGTVTLKFTTPIYLWLLEHM